MHQHPGTKAQTLCPTVTLHQVFVRLALNPAGVLFLLPPEPKQARASLPLEPPCGQRWNDTYDMVQSDRQTSGRQSHRADQTLLSVNLMVTSIAIGMKFINKNDIVERLLRHVAVVSYAAAGGLQFRRCPTPPTKRVFSVLRLPELCCYTEQTMFMLHNTGNIIEYQV